MEVLLNLFTIMDGKLKVLLYRKKTEPYKGYWILPNAMVEKNKTLEETMEEEILSNLALSNLTYKTCATFSALDRNPAKRIIGISFFSIIDFTTAQLRQVDSSENVEWFEITNLPKLGYDHADVVASAIQSIKQELRFSHVLKTLFPSDFTLPEIQKIYEQVLGRELDRRNLRKKFLAAGLIEETGDKTSGTNGRPAKLYRFKDDIENKLLF